MVTTDAELRETLRPVFAQFDADGSGFISSGELVQLLDSCGVRLSKNALDGLMQQVDSDVSGSINFDELVDAVKKDTDRKNSTFQRVMAKAKAAIKANKSYGKMHVRHRALKAAKAVEEGSAVTYVTEADGKAQLAVWQQGDAELSTTENLAKREHLRRDPRVVQALDALFVYIEKAQLKARLNEEGGSFEKIAGDGETFITITYETDLDALLDGLNTNISVDWFGYRALFSRIYKVLLSAEDNKDADECIANDWEEDRNGREYMSREGLGASLFELVDVWTESIDGAAYAKFIWDLMGKILDGGAWRPLDELYCEDDGPPPPRKGSKAKNGGKKASKNVTGERRDGRIGGGHDGHGGRDVLGGHAGGPGGQTINDSTSWRAVRKAPRAPPTHRTAPELCRAAWPGWQTLPIHVLDPVRFSLQKQPVRTMPVIRQHEPLWARRTRCAPPGGARPLFQRVCANPFLA